MKINDLICETHTDPQRHTQSESNTRILRESHAPRDTNTLRVTRTETGKQTHGDTHTLRKRHTGRHTNRDTVRFTQRHIDSDRDMH